MDCRIARLRSALVRLPVALGLSLLADDLRQTADNRTQPLPHFRAPFLRTVYASLRICIDVQEFVLPTPNSTPREVRASYPPPVPPVTFSTSDDSRVAVCAARSDPGYLSTKLSPANRRALTVADYRGAL